MIGVDPKCFDLAEHFLSDCRWHVPEDVQELAEIIQQRIEDFIEDTKPEIPPKPSRDGTRG